MSHVYENCLQHRTGLHLMGMFATEALTSVGEVAKPA